MTRIGHVTPWGIPCGIARHLGYWLPESRRFEHVILGEDPPDWYSRPDDVGSPFPVQRPWRRGREGGLQAIARIAEQENIGILHLQSDPSFWNFEDLAALDVWARAGGAKIVVTRHAVLDLDIYTWVNKRILQLADQIIVGTPGMARATVEYAERFAIPLRRPVAVIPLAAPEIASATQPRTMAIQRPRILTWGFLGHVKGHLAVVHAVRELRSTGFPRANCLVMGLALTGEQRANLGHLRALADREPDLLQVREGYFAEPAIYRVCRESDLVVLNHQVAHQSSSGTVALSVAAGAAVVVNDSPMYSGYVEAGAVRVAERKPDGLLEACWDALMDGQALAAGRARIRPTTTPAAVAARHETIYRELETA